MSTETAKQTAKQTETTASDQPGFFGRAYNSISHAQQRAVATNPIVTHVATIGGTALAAKAAKPVLEKATSGVKKLFGGAARKASEEVGKEVATEGAKAFVGGAGLLRKLARRR